MNKFTEGPWKCDGYQITTADGWYIAELDPEYTSEEHWKADAALIAAAPTLYAACRAALVEFGDDELYHMHRTIHATLSAAILQAEGGSL